MFLSLDAALLDSASGQQNHCWMMVFKIKFRVLIRLLQITDSKPVDFTSANLFWVASALSYLNQLNLALLLSY